MPAMTEARAHFPAGAVLVGRGGSVRTAGKTASGGRRGDPGVVAALAQAACCRPSRGAISAGSRRGCASKQYDKIVDTQGLARTGLISKIARGERHGYDRDSIREKFAARFYNVHHKVPRDIHAIARNRALTGLALGYEPEGEPDYGLERAALAGVPLAALCDPAACHSREAQGMAGGKLGCAGACVRRSRQSAAAVGKRGGTRARRAHSRQLKRAQVPIRRELDDMARMIAGRVIRGRRRYGAAASRRCAGCAGRRHLCRQRACAHWPGRRGSDRDCRCAQCGAVGGRGRSRRWRRLRSQASRRRI